MMSKLTPAMREEIRRRVEAGEGQKAIAFDLKVALSTVSKFGGRSRVRDAVEAERERCAKIVEFADLFWHLGDPRQRIAAKIREGAE